MRHAAAFCLGMALSVRGVAANAQTPSPDFVDENMVTHGPILGRLSSDGVGVWARTLRTGEFSVLYGIDPERLDQVSRPVRTQLEHDNTGWVHITGLAPSAVNVAFSVLIAATMPALYVVLGAGWLLLKTDGELFDKALAWGRRAMPFMGLSLFAISISTPLVSKTIAAAWFSLPNFIGLLPIPLATMKNPWSVTSA